MHYIVCLLRYQYYCDKYIIIQNVIHSYYYFGITVREFFNCTCFQEVYFNNCTHRQEVEQSLALINGTIESNERVSELSSITSDRANVDDADALAVNSGITSDRINVDGANAITDNSSITSDKINVDGANALADISSIMLDRINIDNANVLAGSSSITTHESDSMTKVSNYLALVSNYFTVGSGHSFSPNSRPYVAQTSPGFIFNVPPTNQIDPASLHLIKQSLLQKPERPYNGEPQLYQSFMSQLETKVKGIPLDAWDRILILEAHTTGKPQQVVRSHMTNGSAYSSATLEDILGELKRKFGLGTKVAATIINKIEDLQQVKSIHNTERLEELLEISKLIRTNLSSTEELQQFNGSIGIQKLRSKLPETFQNSWRTVCNDHKQCSYNEHPPFERFFDFLKRKVEEYSDCVYERRPYLETKKSRETTQVRTLKVNHTNESNGSPNKAAWYYLNGPSP